MTKHIPNSITLGNLICGMAAINQSFTVDYEWAILWILGGLFLDFFDGFFARILNVRGEMGKQLDSLADLVSFGIAPSFIIYRLLSELLLNQNNLAVLPYFAFIIALLSAIRLAKFNISTNQSNEFIGLPTPANAIFFASLPIIYKTHFEAANANHCAFLIITLIFVMCYMLNASVRLIALKFKTFHWNENKYRYILLFFMLFTICIALLINSIFIAFPIIILLYILISITKNIYTAK